jgi:hypothetical protein
MAKLTESQLETVRKIKGGRILNRVHVSQPSFRSYLSVCIGSRQVTFCITPIRLLWLCYWQAQSDQTVIVASIYINIHLLVQKFLIF